LPVARVKRTARLDTLESVPADGETLGEIMFRGNICMKGYLKNEAATQAAFACGWFHTGDLGVLMSDGYIRLKDRSKDIIISGGENISSVEVEDAIYRHPTVVAVAVVALPDAKWERCHALSLRSSPGTRSVRRRSSSIAAPCCRDSRCRNR
jgi:fatty-acyl-CoA synthase